MENKVRNNGRFFSKMITFLCLAVGSVVMLLPLYWMLSSSFKPQTELLRMPPTIWPEQFIFSNYLEVLQTMPFGRYYVNSLGLSLINTFVGLISSSLGGYMFAKYEFRFKEVLFWLMMACMMIPYETLLIPLYRIMVSLGWINSYMSLTIPYFVNIFGLFMMRQFMTNISNEFIEAAEIDGCGQYSTFFRIILPMVRPALATLSIFLFMGTYNSFLWPLIAINTRNYFTLPIGLAALSSDRGTQTNLIMAASSLVVVPIVVLFAVIQNQIVSGLTAGGIKG